MLRLRRGAVPRGEPCASRVDRGPSLPGMSFALLHPSWVSAISGAVGVIVAIVAVVLTVRQLTLTGRQMRATARREAEDSEARTRPYVSLDVVPSVTGPPAFDLTISNQGKTTARDVRIALVGQEFGAQSEGDVIGPALGRLFAVGFDLAPGARRRIFWYHPEEPSATPAGPLGVPIAAEILATYGWTQGNGRLDRAYEERLSYDLTELPKLLPLPSSGMEAQGNASDITTHVRNVVHSLRSIAQHLGEARR